MRAPLLALLAVVVLGCRKPAAEAPAAPVDAGARVTAPAAKPAPPPPAERALLTAPSTLSLLEPAGAACAWQQVDPVAGTRVALATFPGACVGARVAWSPDAGLAVVWFDPRHVQQARYSTQVSSRPGFPDEVVDEAATPRAFVVAPRSGKVEPLPLPALAGHDLRRFGVDGAGAVLALLEEAVPEGATGTLTREGEAFDLATVTEGLPVLVHAYRRDGAAWRRVETKLSSTGWDYGLGVEELEAHGRLGPRSEALATSRAQGDVAEDEVLPALTKLSPKGAGPDDGQWIFLGAGGARLFVWEVSGEFAHTTGLLAAGAPTPRPLPGLGFTDGDLVAIRTSGSFALVTAAEVGAHPRLYELPAGALRFSSDTARAVSFWPTTARPESHEAPKTP